MQVSSLGPLVSGIPLITTLSLSPALAADPSDLRCSRGDEVRRIEIRFEDEAGRLPCRVIYRPEDESDEVGIVSWRGFAELAGCEAKAGELEDRLTDEGWQCSEDVQSAADDEPLPETSAEADPSANEAPVAVSPGGASEPIEENAVPVEAAEELEQDPPPILVTHPDIPPAPSALRSLIERDLDRLDATIDGRLEAEIAQYGDLNADDIDDALVLLTYHSPQPAYRQFLAAYLFDGETYQLAATYAVGSNVNATMDAKVEAVDQGIVHLRLKAFEPGDPACCPSGRRDLVLALRDLNFVEIDEAALTR